MQQGDEDRLHLDVITLQTISNLPASAFVQVELMVTN